MALPWWVPLGEVPELDPAALAAARAGPAPPVLLDVRTAAEFAAGHVEGAVSVPITALRGRLAGLGLPPGARVVAICLSAHRSIPAVRLLRQEGHDAAQLAGGMLAWWRAGLPVRRG